MKMKKSRICFVMLISVIMSLSYLSCDKNCEGCGDEIYPFVEYTDSKTFYETYVSYTGPKALVDTREKSMYETEHLEGAVNLPADINNTANNDTQWCKDLLALYPKSTCLFFYGTTSFQMTKAVAGRASNLGYGKNNSRIFSMGYDVLKFEWK